MPSIFEIRNWSDVASFFIWTLAVSAIAKALFGSFLAAEIQHRLALRYAPRRQRMNRLNWEINNRAKWDENVARRSPHAARQSLSDDEMEAKRRELRGMTSISLTNRALTYFLGCHACQTFWVAVGVFAVTGGGSDLAALIFSSAACSAAAVLLSAARHPSSIAARGAATPRTACKACGK